MNTFKTVKRWQRTMHFDSYQKLFSTAKLFWNTLEPFNIVLEAYPVVWKLFLDSNMFISIIDKKLSKSGVNFINILRAAFTYVSCGCSFLCLRFRFVLYWRKTVDTKAVLRMLMELTLGVIIICKFCQKNFHDKDN